MCPKQVIVVKQNIKEQCPQNVFTFKHRLILSLAMERVTLAFCFFVRLGLTLGAATEPFHRHVIVSPHSSSEIFYTGTQRQIVAPAPVYEPALPVAAPAAPVPAVVPAPHLAFATAGAVAAPAAPLAFPAPAAAAVAPAAPLAFPAPAPAVAVGAPAPVVPVAKVAQIKLSYPQYAYGYSVQDFTTGDNKVAKEVREGGVVKGSYSVADPDGTKRTVNYYADPIHGFNAVVHKTQILK